MQKLVDRTCDGRSSPAENKGVYHIFHDRKIDKCIGSPSGRAPRSGERGVNATLSVNTLSVSLRLPPPPKVEAQVCGNRCFIYQGGVFIDPRKQKTEEYIIFPMIDEMTDELASLV